MCVCNMKNSCLLVIEKESAMIAIDSKRFLSIKYEPNGLTCLGQF